MICCAIRPAELFWRVDVCINVVTKEIVIIIVHHVLPQKLVAMLIKRTLVLVLTLVKIFACWKRATFSL